MPTPEFLEKAALLAQLIEEYNWSLSQLYWDYAAELLSQINNFNF